MKNIALSLLALVVLSFSAVACVGQPTDESDPAGDQADSSDESVGEAEQAITVSGLCNGTDVLPSGWRVCFDGPCTTWGNGTTVASITCNQYPYSYCQVMQYPNNTIANYPCPLAGGR